MNLLYHIKFSFRSLWAQRPYSFFNIIGLCIGLSVTFIVLLYVLEETSYNKHHENFDRIYRLVKKGPNGEKSTLTNPNIVKKIKDQLPEVEVGAFFLKSSTLVNEIETICFSVEPDFLDILTFETLKGSLESFKEDPFVIIISEEFATKYFGTENPIGKVIPLSFVSRSKDFTVGGVYKKFPKTSSIRPDIIARFSQHHQLYSFLTDQEGTTGQSYFLLHEGTDIAQVDQKLSEVTKGIGMGQLDSEFELQPLNRVHLFSEDIKSDDISGSIRSLVFFTVTGFFVLLTSVLNFLMLYTAIISRRLKEFGIRQISGAKRSSLLSFLMVESLIICGISSIIAFISVKLMLPYFNELVGGQLELQLSRHYRFIVLIILLVFLITALAGTFFNQLVHNSQPLHLIGQRKSLASEKYIKGKLVITQLLVFSFMIVVFLIYHKQIAYIINADKGFNIENVFVVNRLSHAFEEKLKSYPDIISIAKGSPLPDGGVGLSVLASSTIHLKDKSSEEIPLEIMNISHGYIPLYQIRILQGRNFSEEFSGDPKNSVILNETAIKLLNIKNPIGVQTNWGTIIGVVEDFKFQSFHKAVKPFAFKIDPERVGYCVVKYREGKDKEVLDFLQASATEFDPDFTVFTGYQEEALATLYKDEHVLLKGLNLLTVLALLVAMLGLFGLSLFASELSTKEIGIRKVNGAKVLEVIFLLNKKFLKWVLLAFALACPLAWYVMDRWLQNFAYKTELSWWIFVLAGLITMGIALLTVSWQSWRAASRNPVEALRNE